MNWRIVLLAGVALAIVCAAVGLGIDRNEVGVVDPQGVYYVHQLPNPFEREVFLEPDHRALLSEGDSQLWYFAAWAVLALSLAAVPLLMERERTRRGREAGAKPTSPPVPPES